MSEHVTISVIKADVGSVVGHSRPHPAMIDACKEVLYKGVKSGCLQDFYVTRVGDDINLISSAEETSKQLAGILADLGMLNDGQAGAQAEAGTSHNLYYTTGDAEIFRQVGERWLDSEITVKHIDLAGENRQEEI